MRKLRYWCMRTETITWVLYALISRWFQCVSQTSQHYCRWGFGTSSRVPLWPQQFSLIKLHMFQNFLIAESQSKQPLKMWQFDNVFTLTQDFLHLCALRTISKWSHGLVQSFKTWRTQKMTKKYTWQLYQTSWKQSHIKQCMLKDPNLQARGSFLFIKWLLDK